MAEAKTFGVPDDIEKRLIYWRRQLVIDRRFPWVGSGLLEDLVCAAKLLGGDVSEFERPANNLEFDL